MRNNDHLLTPLRQSIRKSDKNSIEANLSILMKKAQDSLCSPRLRVEIYLEAVKALRVLGRLNEAEQFAEIAVANIPPECLDVLSAIKRTTALLALDRGDTDTARSIIDQTDGLELVLDGKNSVINRKDEEVSVETWLVSTEIALAQDDFDAARDYYIHAVTQLDNERLKLRSSRRSPMDKRGYENFLSDLGSMATLFECVLNLQSSGDLSPVKEYYDEVSKKIASDSNSINGALHSRLTCLLGHWSPTDAQPPHGLTLPEALRWTAFGKTDQAGRQIPPTEEIAVYSPAEDISQGYVFGGDFMAVPSEAMPTDTALSVYQRAANSADSGNQALAMTATAVDKMANVLEKFESVLPHISELVRNQSGASFTQRGFQGHLLDTDLSNFMMNFENMRFTGYLKLKWHKDLYHNLIVKGSLPEIVRSGEASIYVLRGAAIDALFAGQYETHTTEKAQENFVILTRLCFMLDTDGIQPDMIGIAIPDLNVEQRTPLLNISHNGLLFIMSDIEAAVAGVDLSEESLENDAFFSSAPVSRITNEADTSEADSSELELNAQPSENPLEFDIFETKPNQKTPAEKPAVQNEDDLLEF